MHCLFRWKSLSMETNNKYYSAQLTGYGFFFRAGMKMPDQFSESFLI